MSLFNISEKFKIISEDFKTALDSSIEYYKLDFFSKLAKAAVSSSHIIIIGGIFLIFLMFLSVAVAILLGEVLESPSAGFFIVAGFYFLIFLFLFIFGRPIITKKVLTKYSQLVFNEDTQKEVLDDEFKKLVD